ncbi:hypothetical protein [Flavobacterium collinsii]|uniref:Uncharacterized protein n=1 Tax=Flavobacterium collinsii TaxID=1114861 RepID=A0A9W4TI18_9FLAO|nr:hypothetical protein [Flavobacterium collinsii]CAA9200860.1 hypothetical protein FLACOL7796_03482 [Flavobacterium collinsii]CAI2767144.1 conserved protein of unknown function [Flavobacterium collinsii]
MKLIKKNELEKIIGKKSFWSPKKIVGLCEYGAGIEEIDDALGTQNFFKIKPLVNFTKYSDGIEISIMHNFKLYHLAINNSDIKSITLESGGVIDVEERSVIKRAVVGGLLLGPIGAIVGGVSGVKDKIIKDNDSVIIIAQSEGKEQAVICTIKKGKTQELAKFFKENFGNSFSVNK